MMHAWIQSIQPETIKSEFRKAGIYSFDPTAIKPLMSMEGTSSSSSSDTDAEKSVQKSSEPPSLNTEEEV